MRQTGKLATVLAMAFATPVVAEDGCAAILNGGVHNESRTNRTVITENTNKRYVCAHKGEAVTDAKALELGFMIRFFGIRLGITPQKVKEWIDGNCSDTSTSERQTTREDTYSRNADKAIADAWLRCKTLELKSNGIGLTDEVGGQDRDGRAYKFRIAVLGMSYYWHKASTSVVMRKSRPFDIATQLRSREWAEATAGARDLFAVGTASCGGEPSAEVGRALTRARRLQEWIDAAQRANGRPVSRGTINLGRYEEEYCAEGKPASDLQRPIMVLVVTERPDQPLRAIDYHSALMDAAASHPAFQFHRYSNFDIAVR